MADKQISMTSNKKLIIGGAILLAAAAVVTVVVGVVAYNEGKKKSPKCPTPKGPRKYNFYPGLDAYSGIAKISASSATPAQLMTACDSASGCVGFNSNGWMGSSVIPVDQWWAHRGRFSVGAGSYIAEEADPYSAINAPNDPWVYYPGCSLVDLVEPTEVFTGTLEELKAHALSNNYVAFSEDGNMYDYDKIPTITTWNVNTAHFLYVNRDRMNVNE